MALKSEIEAAIERYYKKSGGESPGDILNQMEVESISEASEDKTEYHLEDSDDPVIRFVNMMLVEAINSGASDIHIEPMRNF